MFICNCCGGLKEELETYREDFEHFGNCGSRYVEDAYCSCGGEYVEATECPACGNWVGEEEIGIVCHNCKDEIYSEQNALEYLKYKGLEKDFYINYFTDSETKIASSELLEICKKEWQKDFNKGEILENFIVDGFNDYAQWYVDNKV